MHSKIFTTCFQLILICSVYFIFAQDAACQTNLADSSVSLKLTIDNNGGAINSTRPRVYKDKAPSTETSARKAVMNFAFERKAFEEINQQRTTNGLSPMIWSEVAAKIARLHSENMANFKFFSHEGLDGSMVDDRADSFGINKWKAIGENIAYNHGYENPVEFAVERWMKSPGHRENILNGRWKESGIGVAVTQDGTYYFTEVFLVRK